MIRRVALLAAITPCAPPPNPCDATAEPEVSAWTSVLPAEGDVSVSAVVKPDAGRSVLRVRFEVAERALAATGTGGGPWTATLPLAWFEPGQPTEVTAVAVDECLAEGTTTLEVERCPTPDPVPLAASSDVGVWWREGTGVVAGDLVVGVAVADAELVRAAVARAGEALGPSSELTDGEASVTVSLGFLQAAASAPDGTVALDVLVVDRCGQRYRLPDPLVVEVCLPADPRPECA